MAGLYIHIPFCKQACSYCDFHFSTSLKYKSELLNAIHQEIIGSKGYFLDKKLETIYFGGGTPSVLDIADIESLFTTIYDTFDASEVKEVTFEANPDDLDKDFVRDLAGSPINRLSIGIQSFHDKDLLFMKRAHSSGQARKAIELAIENDFEISADLIYGLPNSSESEWLDNIRLLTAYNPCHISAYQLTIEPKTLLHHQVKTNKITVATDEVYENQFSILIHELAEKGYEQYEISNFCQDGKYALHNSNYWRGKSYLGIGPSAHSFNQDERHWNVANNATYIKALATKEEYRTVEKLSVKNRFNEMLMTGLRTKWGVDLNKIKSISIDSYDGLEKGTEKWIDQGYMLRSDNQITLTAKGKMIADKIISELFEV